uniref:Uncharacterized protein n=1 Tax=Amphiprion ocellaris TaxID=80972 RepID=A0A3Q1CEG2_AMPOC
MFICLALLFLYVAFSSTVVQRGSIMSSKMSQKHHCLVCRPKCHKNISLVCRPKYGKKRHVLVCCPKFFLFLMCVNIILADSV